MDAVNNMLATAIQDDQLNNLQVIQKIVQKLLKVTDFDGTMTEEEFNNWLAYFMPLMFHEKKACRCEVIRGMEALIPKLQQIKYQEFLIWENIRKEIVDAHSKAVNKLFNENQIEWHQTLRILLKILDSVVANNTVAINTFLAIIEKGFRSTDLNIRADAFLCWKVVIEIFIKFGQISDPKRIKLICIPLKSSRSKTQKIAENKFDVWWTLIQALNDKIVDHSHLIESFIFFCLGPFGKQKEPLKCYFDDGMKELLSPGKLFDNIRDASIAAMLYILGEPNRATVRLAKKSNLDFQDNLKICNEKVFEQIGTILVAACIESTVLISKLEQNRFEINECLWESLLKYINSNNVMKYRQFMLDGLTNLKKLLLEKPNDTLKQLFISVICMIVKHKPFIDDASDVEIDEIVQIINTFTDDFKPKQVQSIPPSIRNLTNLLKKKTINSPGVIKSSKEHKKDKEEYVVIPTVWKMNPEKLTEHQLEKMKERRSDIPALYNDMSQSQDAVQLKTWNPKQIVVAADESHDTTVLNDNSVNSSTDVKSPKKTSPKKEANEKSEKSNTSRRKADNPKQVKPRAKKNEVKNLIIDTVQGKELMKQLNTIPTRRNSLERGAKFAEPAWKKSLLPHKKPRKTRSESAENVNSTPKKNLSKAAQDEANTKSSNTKTPSSEQKKSQNENELVRNNSPEIVECSQNVTPKTPSERRLSRRELMNASKIVGHKINDAPPENISPKTLATEPETPRVLRNMAKPETTPTKTVLASNVATTPTTHQSTPLVERNIISVKTESPIKNSNKDTPIVNRDKSVSSPRLVSPNKRTTELTDTKQISALIKDHEKVDLGISVLSKLSPSPKKVSQKPIQNVPETTERSLRNHDKSKVSPVKALQRTNTPEMVSPVNSVISRDQVTPAYCSPRKPTENDDTQKATVPLAVEWPVKSASPTEGSTPIGADENLKELRRSPRKPQTELKEDGKNSPEGNMPALCVSPSTENVQRDPDLLDRRKSPRKTPVPTPVFSEINKNESPTSKRKSEEALITPLKKATRNTLTKSNSPLFQSDHVKCELEFPNVPEFDEKEDQNLEISMEVDMENEDGQINLLADIADENGSPPSPAPNLDEQLEPIDRSMTIVSSPDTSLIADKLSEFMSSTIEISPINSNKTSPVTRQSLKNQASEQSTSPLSTQERKITRASALSTEASGIMSIESPKSGRAARIMNMIFKNNSSTPNPPQQQQPGTSKSFSMVPNKPEAYTNMLVFSKTLPHPDASPSASILKRKLDESSDDIESPANKRKRVSFHDPPVSVTKQYIRHEEEIKSPSVRPPINRCLLMVNVNQQKTNNASNISPINQLKYTLKRKGKRDSRDALMKLKRSPTINNSQAPQIVYENPEEDTKMEIPKIPESAHDNVSELPNLSQADIVENKDASIRFANKAEVLQYCLNSYPLEEILESYFEENKPLTPKAARIMSKELTNQMETDSKLRFSILDRLSEKHALEFLEHAIQENSSKTICESLTLPVIMNHISEKISSDQAAKVQVLKQFETLLTGDAQTAPVLSRQEIITFLINILPDEVQSNEITLILDELLSEKSGAELYEIFTSYFRKYFVSP